MRQKDKAGRDNHVIQVADQRTSSRWGSMGFLDSQFNILPLRCLSSQMAFILSGFSMKKLNALLSWGLCCLVTLWQPRWGMQLRQMNRLANEQGLGFQHFLPQEPGIPPAEKWRPWDSLIIKIKSIIILVCQADHWSQDTVVYSRYHKQKNKHKIPLIMGTSTPIKEEIKGNSLNIWCKAFSWNF